MGEGKNEKKDATLCLILSPSEVEDWLLIESLECVSEILLLKRKSSPLPGIQQNTIL